jgi:hypothetical protein
MLKFLLFFFFSTAVFSQEIHEFYPPNQTDYIGGNVQFYKDFHQVLVEKKLQPCANKEESLNFGVVIYPDNSIKYIKGKDPDEEKFKCTFDLTKEVLKYVKGWNPAVVDNKKVAAATSFLIIPNDLFSKLPDEYDTVGKMEMATYDGGMQTFRKKVFQSIDLNRFKFDGTFRLEVTFIIERNGSMSTVELAQSSGLQEFDKMVINSISKIKNKWTPGKINGVPVRYRFRLPLAFAN